jgi:hypothetical protein
VPELLRPSARRCCAGLAGALLLAVSACSGEGEPAADESPTPTAASTATIEPAPVPAKVRVTRVSGTMKGKDQEVLADNVGKVLTGYFDDAFLGGDYPRESFGSAFATFTRGAAATAKRQKGLLTNRRLGPTTEVVVPRRQTAYLSVLAPHRVAAGVTAKVHLRYLAQRADRPDVAVTVKGRLNLTRDKSGGWTIFGYDLTRSSKTVGEGS